MNSMIEGWLVLLASPYQTTITMSKLFSPGRGVVRSMACALMLAAFTPTVHALSYTIGNQSSTTFLRAHIYYFKCNNALANQVYDNNGAGIGFGQHTINLPANACHIAAVRIYCQGWTPFLYFNAEAYNGNGECGMDQGTYYCGNAPHCVVYQHRDYPPNDWCLDDRGMRIADGVAPCN